MYTLKVINGAGLLVETYHNLDRHEAVWIKENMDYPYNENSYFYTEV